MYRVAICDDEVGTCTQVETVIMEYAQREGFQTETEVFCSGESLKRKLMEGSHYNIIFLDINLPGVSGVEIGEIIRQKMKDEMTHIVYISQQAGYAMELFKVRPLDFLIKPVSKEKIESALQISRKLNSQNSQVFAFQLGKQEFFLPYYEILYFLNEGKKIKVVCKNPKNNASYYGAMKDLEKNLPSRRFWEIHKSYVINSGYVIRFAADEVEMVNGDILPISQKHRKAVKEKVMKMQEDEGYGGL